MKDRRQEKKEYYQKNKEHIKEYHKIHNKKPEVKERKRIYFNKWWKKWYPKNKEKKAKMQKKYNKNNPNFDLSKVERDKFGKFIGKSMKGNKNPNWRGGISKLPYPFDFTEELKKSIRKRDNYTCQECKFTQEQLGYNLHTHHIDYNKQNNNSINLISLCRNCHMQTNFKREDWIEYFQNKGGNIHACKK